MNKQHENPVIIKESDYARLKPYLHTVYANDEKMSLSYELSRAIIVKKEAFPANTVGIGSKVSILDLHTNKIIEFTLVMPEYANIKTNKVSILTPMGAALIGFRKGEEVKWKVPGGLKHFSILDVVNDIN